MMTMVMMHDDDGDDNDDDDATNNNNNQHTTLHPHFPPTCTDSLSPIIFRTCYGLNALRCWGFRV